MRKFVTTICAAVLLFLMDVENTKCHAFPSSLPVAKRTIKVHKPEIAKKSEITMASWYGGRFHQGKLTATGQRFDMKLLTAAHRTRAFWSKVKVTVLSTGKSVIVMINDRGPYKKGRGIDLSWKAAHDLGIVKQGLAKVKIEEIS